MTEMIDANQAKEILGCDDATLQNHINGGVLRAQRVGGKLMLHRDEVERLKGDDDGTIVLTGDSENLSIDLGKVVDDTSATIVQAKKQDSASITFGEELEVVSFDDTASKNVTLETKNPNELSFTDSNTAVSATAVEETQVGGTTSPIEFNTAQQESPAADLSTDAGRRSVRSSRAKVEPVNISFWWPLVAGLTLFIGLGFIAPYYVMSAWPHGQDEKDSGGYTWRGVDDNGWTNMSSAVAGVSAEPNKTRYGQVHGDTNSFRDMREVDPQAAWRFAAFQDGLKEKGERTESFIIEKISDDGTKATSKGGKREYPVTEVETQLGSGGVAKELKVNLTFSDK